MTINLLEDVAPASKNLGEIAEIASKIIDAQKNIDQIERQLKAKKQELRELQEIVLPDAMQESGITSFELSDGSKVKVKDFTSVSLPTQSHIDRTKDEDQQSALIERRQSGLDWLIKNQGESIIKNTVKVLFDVDAEAQVKSLMDDLSKKNLLYKVSVDVHPRSLKSFIESKIAEGKSVPHETFKIFNGRIAEITSGDKK